VKRSALSLAAIASLVAGAALAGDASQTATTQPPPKGFDRNQIICKRVDVTDSHLGGQKVCATWAQWDAQSQIDQQAMRDAMGRPGTSGVASNFGSSSTGGRAMH
jgi:hypothetical protein